VILRRVIEHVREQNWTAIAIDFVIVVVGVFIGIQFSNWNAAQAGHARERLLLAELRAELTESVEQLTIKRNAYGQVGRSGERSIAFLDRGETCGDQCWNVILDFFHASQWQQIVVPRSTYDEMRRNGWPRNRDIIDALEAYHRQADQIAQPMAEVPAYRALVRGLIPLVVHRQYWKHCFELADGEERYREDCPEGVEPAISTAGVASIMAHSDVHPALTEWAGFAGATDAAIVALIAAAERAIARIDAELGDRS
jgi:hypothetical protein